METSRAPCVAVVGPAGSGKTTLLHLLDQALQLHPDRPLVYVLKGNPDGTGRYLFHAPRLREALKPRVKGAWSSVTVTTIATWIERCRRRLELVVLDFGGRHADLNHELLARCSHFIVVAKSFDDPAEEEREGMESWIRVGRQAGLELLARVRSLWGEGSPTADRAADGVLDVALRADACAPGDPTNTVAVEAIVETLVRLRQRRGHASYFDLRLGRDWTFEDLPDLAGLAPALEEVARGGQVLLGGLATPIWAYAAALHRLLDVSPEVAVEVFDPKTPAGVVRLPILQSQGGGGGRVAAESLSARWAAPRDGVGVLLDLRISTPDRWLPPEFTRHLPFLPLPEGPPPVGPIVVSGAAPVWLHLAYSRWLRSLSGARPLGHWDARSESAVFVTGPGAPYRLPWRVV